MLTCASMTIIMLTIDGEGYSDEEQFENVYMKCSFVFPFSVFSIILFRIISLFVFQLHMLKFTGKNQSL